MLLIQISSFWLRIINIVLSVSDFNNLWNTRYTEKGSWISKVRLFQHQHQSKRQRDFFSLLLVIFLWQLVPIKRMRDQFSIWFHKVIPCINSTNWWSWSKSKGALEKIYSYIHCKIHPCTSRPINTFSLTINSINYLQDLALCLLCLFHCSAVITVQISCLIICISLTAFLRPAVVVGL